MLSQLFVSIAHVRSQRHCPSQEKNASHKEGTAMSQSRSCAGSRSRRRGTRLLSPHVNGEDPNKRLQSSGLTAVVDNDNNRGTNSTTMDDCSFNRLLQPQNLQNSPLSNPSTVASSSTSPACSPCQSQSQPLNHAHHDHRTAAPRNRNLPPSSRTATPPRLWSSTTASAVLGPLIFLLVFELFSHQFLSAHSVHAQDVEPRRISTSSISNNYYNLINLTNNKVFHHNRSIATIPTTTARTGSGTSGKTKVRPLKLKPVRGSKAKGSGSGKSRPKPEKNKVRGNSKEDETEAGAVPLRPRDPNNKPLYMKQTPPPVEGGNFYLSTSKIPSSTPVAGPSPTGPSNAAAIRFRRPPRPSSLWNPSAPDISSSDSDNLMSYWKGSNKLPPMFGHYTFSTTTSRSMSSRLPPPPSFQYIRQPQTQLDPLSILKTEMQTTTGKSKENDNEESELDRGKGRSDMDDDKNDEDEDDSVGRSNIIEILKTRSPIYERPKTTATTFNVTTVSSGVTSGKKLTSNFFENFEDHWDDPIAEETRAPQEVIATVPAPTGPSGGESSQQIHSTASSPTAPSPTSPSQETTGSGATGSGTGPDPNLKNHRYSIPQDYGTGPSSPEHGHLNPPTLQNYPPHHHFRPGSLHKHPNSKHSYFSSHKNANYWPQKLNSYYGESVSAQVAHQHMLAHSPPPRPPPLPPPPPHLVNRHRQRARFPPAGAYPVPAHPQHHHLLQPLSGPPQLSHVLNPNLPSPHPPKHDQKLQASFPVPHARPLHRPRPTGPAPTPTAHSGTLIFSNSIEEQLLGTTATGPTAGTAEDQEFHGSEHNPHQKVSMIDRVSTFYANYKLLAWGGIVLFVSIGILGAIAALYMNNPPTEVVTARRDLVTRLSDPSVKKFLQSLMEGSGVDRKETSKDHTPSTPVEDAEATGKDVAVKSSTVDSRIRTRRKRSKQS